MKNTCSAHSVAYWLMWFGALNWGLVGVFNWNLVNTILGGLPVLERVVYILIGLAAVFALFSGTCKSCKTK